MRTSLIIAAVIVAAVLPSIVGPKIAAGGSPRTLIAFTLGCVTAVTFGFVALLGALLDPSALPVSELPVLVGRCVDAASKLFEHPVEHWPQVAAALALLAVVGRLLYATIVVVRGARRQFRSMASVAVGHLGGSDRELVVPASLPFAFAAGVIRRRVVVSTGLLSALDTDAREAVLAHERAHVRGLHTIALLLGRIVAKAFFFLPPIARSMDLIRLGLEMAADEAAARKVGDRIVVADALLQLADVPTAPRAESLAAVGGDLGLRVRRLLEDRPHDSIMRATDMGAIVLMAAVLLALTLSLPARAQALTRAGRAVLVHDVCHLPHDA